MGVLEVLANKNILKTGDIPAIKKESSLPSNNLEKVLLKRGVRGPDLLLAKSESLGVPIRELGDNNIPFEVLKMIPEESAVHYKFAPISVKNGVLEVGLVNPDNIAAKDALTFISTKAGLPFKIFLISEEDFKKVIGMYKGLSGEVTKALSELETELSGGVAKEVLSRKADKVAPKLRQVKGKARIIEDAPVTKIVATVLRYATEGNASDIHIEPMVDRVRVRFRVDGTLSTSLMLPSKVHNAVVARIKILSKTMKLDEKRKPQDGSFFARIDGRHIDFRVSTFPSSYGEKIVMRILDSEKGVRTLDEIGIFGRNKEILEEAIRRPFGLILISGPTGSGKTTTLYSMMNLINDDKRNILSLEDPIEYNVSGINQSQVRPEIGYTFANGLRTTLRQDPDVIMVGEIRDKETAGLAVQAALTGHLVLSTIHTNNAIGIIPRLIDMGVDPYLIAPTLILGVAQRLVKLICPGSGKKMPIEGSIKIMMDKQFNDLPPEFMPKIAKDPHFLEIEPTSECPNGTRGRLAVFEMFKMDKDVEKTILSNPAESEVEKVLRAKGMLTMKEDAIIKAIDGKIPFSEVNSL